VSSQTAAVRTTQEQTERLAAATEPAGATGPSLGDLVQTASRDLSLLLRQEVELAKAEMAATAKGVAKGAAGLIAAAVLALAGATMLMFTIAEAFSEVLPRPLGFLVTALLFLLPAGLAALVGLRGLKKAPKPTRTVATVKDDIAWAKHPTVAPPSSSH